MPCHIMVKRTGLAVRGWGSKPEARLELRVRTPPPPPPIIQFHNFTFTFSHNYDYIFNNMTLYLTIGMFFNIISQNYCFFSCGFNFVSHNFWLYFSHCHFIFLSWDFLNCNLQLWELSCICNLISEKYDFVSIWLYIPDYLILHLQHFPKREGKWCVAKYGDPYLEFVLCIWPIQVHTHSSEHTPGAVGSQFCGALGTVGGSVPCSRVSPQSWYWRWRERCSFTPPTYNPCRTWEPTTFGLQVQLSIH